jgi:hypothetical protein
MEVTVSVTPDTGREGAIMANKLTPASDTLYAEVPKAQDLVTRVRTVEVGGSTVVEMRDYIPSLQEYGRGYWVPLESNAITTIIDALMKIENER